MTKNSFQQLVDEDALAEQLRLEAIAKAKRDSLKAIADAEEAQRLEINRVWALMKTSPVYAELKEEGKSQQIFDAIQYFYTLVQPHFKYRHRNLLLQVVEETVPLAFKCQIAPVFGVPQPELEWGITCGFAVTGYAEKPSEKINQDKIFSHIPFSFSVGLWMDDSENKRYGLWSTHDTSDSEGNYWSTTDTIKQFTSLSALLQGLLEVNKKKEWLKYRNGFCLSADYLE